ncbi:MAG TPA: Tad domain-containing protein [Candidatus Solibacter sp.]|jgi:hypothetical protein|nr:Tad domain-containing protein [Candidatus Solibacter sp.]
MGRIYLGRQARSQRGQALIIVAISLTFLVAIAGLAIEGGIIQADRRFDQAVSDGAALAGAHKLPTDPIGARNQAARYAIAGLNGGVIPRACSDADIAAVAADTQDQPGVALSTDCDPIPPHTLQIHTNYNGQPNQILVRLNHGLTLNLGAVVGAGTAATASRSVAQSQSSGTPFGITVYAGGNLHTVGNVDTVVSGNVYVRGCIENNNQDHLIVKPSGDGTQVGSVEVYGDPAVPGVGVMPQVWTTGSGSGCSSYVDGSAGPSQWGASGHVTGKAACAPVAGSVPGKPKVGFNLGSCPTGEPPVPLTNVPTFTVHDGTGCPGGPVAIFSTTLSVAVPGCYSACAAGGGNMIVPDQTVLTPGTYSFVGNGVTGCDVMLAGSASVAASGGDGFGGVSFLLYGGASICTGTHVCGTADSSGTVTLNAPNVPSAGDLNYGILFFSCNVSCTNASGIIDFEGPALNVNLTGMVYNPGGDCTVHSNAGQGIVGQLICDNVYLQGGSVSTGSSISWGGGVVASPNFLAQLIE